MATSRNNTTFFGKKEDQKINKRDCMVEDNLVIYKSNILNTFQNE